MTFFTFSLKNFCAADLPALLFGKFLGNPKYLKPFPSLSSGAFIAAAAPLAAGGGAGSWAKSIPTPKQTATATANLALMRRQNAARSEYAFVRIFSLIAGSPSATRPLARHLTAGPRAAEILTCRIVPGSPGQKSAPAGLIGPLLAPKLAFSPILLTYTPTVLKVNQTQCFVLRISSVFRP